ncbi:MAG TPA: FkbM family methyltransferase [Thermoplasmata archaeon]|nr:FkbM family methyltransferase [Thermoplasmata archaeon]
MESDTQTIGSPAAEVSRNRVSLAGIRRAIETIRWGRRPRDRALIAAYYGLLTSSQVFRGRHGIGVGMCPEFWLGDIAVETPIGRFACRARTTDFDIVNPNHEAELVRRIERRLARAPNGDAVFVDVGAHIGKYTILAARLLGSGGRVVAIEPDPSNFAALTTNVGLNRLDNVRAFNVGCWSSDGKRILHRQVGNLGGHSFVDSTEGESISVPVRTLDGLLAEAGAKHVDAMKLDVQRAESEVLLGASSTLQANRPVTVFFEESGDPRTASSIRMLRALGFVVDRVDEVNHVAERPEAV